MEINAYKVEVAEPVQWVLRPKVGSDRHAVWHKIEVVDEVFGIGGYPMIRVHLRRVADYMNPGTGVAVLVGGVARERTNPQPPELWFWKDKFWMKAVAGDGQVYYHKKCYALYEVQVQNPDELLQQTSFGI